MRRWIGGGCGPRAWTTRQTIDGGFLARKGVLEQPANDKKVRVPRHGADVLGNVKWQDNLI